jgi:hypothetical protein
MKVLGSGGFSNPEAILFDEGVCEDHQLSHDGCQGKFFSFSSGEKAFMEALEVRIEARRRMSSHIDAGAHGMAATLDAAGTVALTAVAGDRRKPSEHAGLLGVETAELGHIGEQSARCYRSNAWNGDEDFKPAREGWIGLDGLNGQGFDRVRRCLGGFDLTHDLALNACNGGGRKLVSERHFRCQGCLAISDNFTKSFNSFRQRWRCREPGHQAEGREHPCIDGIGFCKAAKRLGEEPGAQRVDDGGREPSIVQKTVNAAMIFARRLHHGDSHRSCL